MSSERSPFCSAPHFLTGGCDVGTPDIYMANSAYLQAASDSVFKLSWAPTKAKVRTSRDRCSRKAGLRRPRAPRATRGLHRQQPSQDSSARRPPQRGVLLSATVPSGCGVSSGPGLSPHPDTPALEEGLGPQGWLRWRKETAGGVRSEAPSPAEPRHTRPEVPFRRANCGCQGRGGREKATRAGGRGRGLTRRGVSAVGRGRSLGGRERERGARTAGLRARAGRCRKSRGLGEGLGGMFPARGLGMTEPLAAGPPWEGNTQTVSRQFGSCSGNNSTRFVGSLKAHLLKIYLSGLLF